MAINLSIRWNHPEATSAQVRYARVDNTSTPTYVLVTPNQVVTPTTTTISVATNLPNGQYIVESTPIYADGRVCAATVDYTAACPGLINIAAYINSGTVVVDWTADAAVPKARISISWPNGGTYANLFPNLTTINSSVIPIPPGSNGTIILQGQSVCDESTGFYSSPSNSITLNNGGDINPIPGFYTAGTNLSLLCDSTVLTLYTNGAFGIGSVVYVDAALTVPFTGYSYISVVSTSKIYAMSTTTGEVTSDINQYCNVFVSNNVLTDSYTISAITGITGFTFPGLLGGETYTGTRTGAGSYAPAVTVSSTSGAFRSISLYKNAVLQECLAVSGDATYTFASISVVATDSISIESNAGAC